MPLWTVPQFPFPQVRQTRVDSGSVIRFTVAGDTLSRDLLMRRFFETVSSADSVQEPASPEPPNAWLCLIPDAVFLVPCAEDAVEYLRQCIANKLRLGPEQALFGRPADSAATDDVLFQGRRVIGVVASTPCPSAPSASAPNSVFVFFDCRQAAKGITFRVLSPGPHRAADLIRSLILELPDGFEGYFRGHTLPGDTLTVQAGDFLPVGVRVHFGGLCFWS